MTNPYSSIIDLDQYPLDQPDSSEYTQLVQTLAKQLDQQQICTMPDFLQESARQAEVSKCMALQDQANPASSLRNVYLERSRSDELADDHPRNLLAAASYRMIGAHILDQESALKKLYYWDNFRQFVSDIVGESPIYPSDDPYQPVNVLTHCPGDKSAWHFDSTNSFTMTLMLQAPEEGGVFELAPNIRSKNNPNIDELKKVLLGDRSRVRCYDRNERALVIFRGCYSAHRVTEVKGAKPRLMCVMVYENRPGVIGDPVVNETVYGIKQKTGVV